MGKRRYGVPIRWNKRGQVVEIQLHLYEQVELARHNIKACREQRIQEAKHACDRIE